MYSVFINHPDTYIFGSVTTMKMAKIATKSNSADYSCTCVHVHVHIHVHIVQAQVV